MTGAANGRLISMKSVGVTFLFGSMVGANLTSWCEIQTFRFDDPAWNAAPGPAQAFLGGWPRQGPVPNGLANEVLRQLAILYLREPNSQVDGIHVGPGHTRGVRVVITLDLWGQDVGFTVIK
jgi:hypothetical protein